jgi:hypothetical protein
MTPEEMVYGLLTGHAPLTALVADRITPQVNTQEPTVPFVVYERSGIEKQPKLDGKATQVKVLVDVSTYARTEAEYQNAAAEVVNALDGKNARAQGLLAAFHVDSQAGTTEDGFRFMRHTFACWCLNARNA